MIILNFEKKWQDSDIVILQFGNNETQEQSHSITGGVSLGLLVSGNLSYDSDVFRGLICESAVKRETAKRFDVGKMAVVRLSPPPKRQFSSRV